MAFLVLTVVFHKRIFAPIPVSLSGCLPGSSSSGAESFCCFALTLISTEAIEVGGGQGQCNLQAAPRPAQPLLCSPLPLPAYPQWDYTRIKVEEAPEAATLRRLQAASAAAGSGDLAGRLGDLERQVGWQWGFSACFLAVQWLSSLVQLLDQLDQLASKLVTVPAQSLPYVCRRRRWRR